eukprot:CAMPEP_0206279002 /NCGR_PEP_ID=MMETSP0047_2-20121206/37770_1 /ASSEMBLY_ACC=CAM_ASM_000192 /TAXON_ID=195065 /ORGANISM="Chroomonas mesostigmatica_cf, Strain CCMP1168" /LENGTH=112 /DNA_ID=CAMNT_0053708883 /DNA_START=296 /DNA_END=634 /DNA_ORIENTATION=+
MYASTESLSSSGVIRRPLCLSIHAAIAPGGASSTSMGSLVASAALQALASANTTCACLPYPVLGHPLAADVHKVDFLDLSKPLKHASQHPLRLIGIRHKEGAAFWEGRVALA